MNIDFSKYNIYIKPGVTDMRKRAESLSFLVRTEMGMDPMEKSIFLFCGKNRHRIVAIVWESNGWLEISKRLDCTGGTFCWPKSEAEAEEVLAATDEELTATLSHEGRGKTTSVSIDDLRALSTNSIGVSYRSDMVKDSAEKVIYLNGRESKITETLYAHEMEVHSKEIEILTSIPGVGNKTACQFMAEVGDINNFSTYQKLIAFIGTDPGIYQSGQQNSSGHITKHGNANLRRVCYIMATKCVAWNPVLGDYYTKKRGEGFSHRKAMIATSNKMIKIIFTLLTRGETFKLQTPVPQSSQESTSSTV